MSILSRRKLNRYKETYVINATDNPKIMSLIYTKGWCRSPERITDKECAAVTDIQFGETFRGSYTSPEGYNISNSDKESFDGLKYFTGLTQIPENAFRDNNWIDFLTIPKTATSIEFRAFCNARMTSLTVPGNVKEIKNGAFLNTRIQHLTLEYGVQRFGQDAFRYAEYILGDFIIPDSVTSMGGDTGTFQNLSASYVKLSANCTTVPSRCFLSSLMSSVDIPEGVSRILSLSFNSCTRLNHVEFPSTLVFIGNRAFNPQNIQYFIFKTTTPPLLDPRPNSTTYENFAPSATSQRIYVPDSAVEAYKTATGWTTFADRIKPISEFSEST